MKEVKCPHYQSEIQNRTTVLSKIGDDSIVIVTRARLLQVCEECPDNAEEDCPHVRELFKVLKYK